MAIETAQRLKELPPYLFAEIDRLKAEARARGVDLIDFGVGDPDLPTAPHVIQALGEAAAKPENHRYPAYDGTLACRQAAADFYRSRFGVELDPQGEVWTLIGSKEGLAHLPLALLNPGDWALVPDPAYPVYAATVRFVGGQVFTYGLRREHQFLPDLESIPEKVAREAKLLYINYPNNPTGGTPALEDFAPILTFAQKHDLWVVSDLSYSEMFFEDPPPPSFLQLDGAKERCIEFFSLSKTYNMTGWRIGYAVGQRELVGALGRIKTNMDSGVFGAVQAAGIAALNGDQSGVEAMRATYKKRRDALCRVLTEAGFDVAPPRATFYVYLPVPGAKTSMEFAAQLLQEAGVVVTPGVGFGEKGEGFVRFALTVSEERIAEAGARLKKLGL